MSFAFWIYPIVLIFIIFLHWQQQAVLHKSLKSLQSELCFGLVFLIPWIFYLLSEETFAPWLGLEVVSLILICDLLRAPPRAYFLEAWVKICISWFMGWLFIGLAIALHGIQGIRLDLTFPLNFNDYDQFRAVASILFFTIGLCLKLGLPPFQQGYIDVLEIIDEARHQKLALQWRWCLAFSVWPLIINFLDSSHEFGQMIFAGSIVFGIASSILLARVQAGVQRTLAYLGALTMGPILLGPLLIDRINGLGQSLMYTIWCLSGCGFVCLAWIYACFSGRKQIEDETLLWSDEAIRTKGKNFRLAISLWSGWVFLNGAVFLAYSTMQGPTWGVFLWGMILFFSAAPISELKEAS